MTDEKQLFKKYIDDNFSSIFKDLSNIIACDSRYDETTISKDAPFGKGALHALTEFLSLGKKYGLTPYNCDGYAGHLSTSFAKSSSFGIVGHIDTVGFVENQWKSHPLKLVIDGDRLVGRGVVDDKGPMIMSLWCYKALKDLGFHFKKDLRLIIGCDEERTCKCIEYYKSKNTLPDFSISPDGEFPCIFCEKTISQFWLNITFTKTNFLSIKSGNIPNAVPSTAVVTIKIAKWEPELAISFEKFLHKNSLTGSIVYKNNVLTICVNGKSAHSCTPGKGKNAFTYLCNFVEDKLNDPLAVLINNFFHNDPLGNLLKINFFDKVQQELTITGNIFKLKNNCLSILIDCRFPTTLSSNSVIQKIRDNFSSDTTIKNIDIEIIKEQGGFITDTSSELFNNALRIYRDVSGDVKTKPIVTGGGTYSRMVKNCFTYGVLFPWSEETFHQIDEYITINDFKLALLILMIFIAKTCCYNKEEIK